MRNFINIIKEMLQREPLFEMSNLRSEDTGLPFVVFVSQRAGSKHDVRIKVSSSIKFDPRNTVTVALRPVRTIGKHSISGKNFDLLKDWITLNYDTLLGYWNEELSTREMLDGIQAI